MIYASGSFKNVYRGTYTEGARSGQACVSKEFKTGSTVETQYFQEELEIIKLTQKIIDDFHTGQIINRQIVLNTPEIWRYEETGNLSLVEPMIDNFEKYNSNTGWASIR